MVSLYSRCVGASSVRSNWQRHAGLAPVLEDPKKGRGDTQSRNSRQGPSQVSMEHADEQISVDSCIDLTLALTCKSVEYGMCLLHVDRWSVISSLLAEVGPNTMSLFLKRLYIVVLDDDKLSPH
jgi:hypothetical protein